MRRPSALLLIGALGLLIGALAVGGLTVWMGDDDDAQSRRTAALPSDPPPDPGGSDPPPSPPPEPAPATQPSVAPFTGPRLKVQVARIGITPDPKASSYYVRESEVWSGVRTAESAGLCVSAPPPGKTCYWDYDPAVEPPCPTCYTVAVRLFAYPTRSQWIPNGALVDWTGCQPQSTRPDLCYVSRWSGEKTVTVVFKQ